MTLILNHRFTYIFLTLCLSWSFFTSFAYAQGGLSITVSPTLFDITAAPGQVWQSELRIINSNLFDLTIYTENVNFGTDGETGRPNFLKILESETQGETLAEWVSVEEGPILVRRQEAVSIPFSVIVPEKAPPGGHYAAILVGTRANESSDGLVGAQTAQFVSSLLFLRVDGEVTESGRIRSFRTDRNVSQTADIDFSLRFENTGNVHLLPRGEIQIFNMWGQSRGLIPVNQGANFGRVLQNSVRNFNFSWSGNISPLDIGRYKAIVTLSYGETESKFSDAVTYFWVIPFTAIGLILGTIILIGSIVVWLVKLYIRRMLSLAGIDVRKQPVYDPDSVVISKYNRATAPVRSSVHSLRKNLQQQESLIDKILTFIYFAMRLRLFWAFTAVTVLIGYVTTIFITSVTDTEREFTVTIQSDETSTIRSLSSEEVYFEQTVKRDPVYVRELSGVQVGLIPLTIINTSGQLGVAAKVARHIESFGFNIVELSSDFSRQNSRTVILYTTDYQDVALAISRELGGALLSQVDSVLDKDIGITVLVGSDQI